MIRKGGRVTTPTPETLLVLSVGVSLVPILIGIATSYLKVSIVLGMLRSGLGTTSTPSGLVIAVISLGLTAYIMAPVLDQMHLIVSQQPRWPADIPGALEVARRVGEPLVSFMRLHGGERELSLVVSLGGNGAELRTIMMVFLLTELREAFTMGLIVLLPFLAIDLIVATLLVGMNMVMVSPVMITLPVKLLVFTLADGWLILARGLVLSYGGG